MKFTILASALLVSSLHAFQTKPYSFLISKDTVSPFYTSSIYTSPSTNLRSTPQPCDIPTDIQSSTLQNSMPLRNAIVTSIDDQLVPLSKPMGEGTSVVVFLRHMGWPYCWTYANAWSEFQPKLNDSNVKGPIFVSIGDKEKLETFLEKNPKIDRTNMFVDNYSFDAVRCSLFSGLFEMFSLYLFFHRLFFIPSHFINIYIYVKTVQAGRI